MALQKGKLIAVIGDEETVVGFLLGGVGERNKNMHPNFFVVDKHTSIAELDAFFQAAVKRPDIDIILINQVYANMIRSSLDAYNRVVPAVLEIPSKDFPYDPTSDSILRRAKGMFSSDDFR